MKTAQFGKTELEITRVGLGAWAIGGQWEWGWGKQEDADSIKTIHAALDSGINWIDTAPVYGLGHSEEVVAKALKSTSHNPFIFTKCGFIWDDNKNITPSLKAETVEKELDDSLKRLNIDTIDLYQIHWPNPEEQIEEAWKCMTNLKAKGKIRHIGVSNHSISQMEKLNTIAPVETLQPQYSLVAHEVQNDILPWCKQENVGVICYSPMGSGLLTGKFTRERMETLAKDDWRHNNDNFKDPKFSKNLELVEILNQTAEELNCSTAEVAIAWTLTNASISGAIVGMRSPEQVSGVIKGGEITIPDSSLQKINSFANTHIWK